MIRFEVECHTQWGESVAVCGSGHLGDWDVGRCLVLEPTAYPIWSGEVSAGLASLEYKYVLVQAGGDGNAPRLVGWENAGPNRKVEFHSPLRRLILSDHFGSQEEVVKPKATVEPGIATGLPDRPAALLHEREVHYISAEELAARLGDPRLEVVDVRDDDFVGGHIAGARNCPSESFHLVLPDLVRELAMEEKTVVFHCMFSRSRGPRCARLFLQHLEQHFPRWRCAVHVLTGGYDRWEVLFARDPDVERYIADRPAEPEFGPKNFYTMKS